MFDHTITDYLHTHRTCLHWPGLNQYTNRYIDALQQQRAGLLAMLEAANAQEEGGEGTTTTTTTGAMSELDIKLRTVTGGSLASYPLPPTPTRPSSRHLPWT